MLDLNITNWKKIIEKIRSEDIYEEEGFGLEDKPHVTIMYGFSSEIDSKQVLEEVKDKKPDSIVLSGISLFKDQKYDVVKFDVESPELHKLHDLVKKKFSNKETYAEYKPHVTIAYVKPGMGRKYVGDLPKKVRVNSTGWRYTK